MANLWDDKYMSVYGNPNQVQGFGMPGGSSQNTINYGKQVQSKSSNREYK